MTPDLFSSSVILDTSILKGTSVSAAPFQVLKGLVAAGLVKVLVPHLALEEFRTQWREKHLSNAAKAEEALKALSGDLVLPEDLGSISAKVATGLATVAWEDRSRQFLKDYMQASGFLALPLSMPQCVSAWDDYFSGTLPSKKVKHRSDLPDAHILAAVREYASTNSEISFVSKDKGQREAADVIKNVATFESLEEFVKSPTIKPFIAKWEIDQKWKIIQESLSIENIIERVRSFVSTEGGDLLSWSEVIDPGIPEDNNTALITMYGEPDEIELKGPEDWGGGLMRFEANFFSECLLSFAVFKGDAYDLPEWVSVSGEVNDHYFDAEGYANLLVKIDMTVRIEVEEGSEHPVGSVIDISFESNSMDISLADL